MTARRPGDYARADLARIAASSRRADANSLAGIRAAWSERAARAARREKIARAFCVAILVALLPALFILATR